MNWAWWTILGSLGLGLAAASLATPALRRVGMGEVVFDWLDDELTFDRVDADGRTVRLKDGSGFQVFRLRGVNYDAMPEAAQANLLASRAKAIQQLHQLGVTLRFFAIKRDRDITFEAQWPCEELKEIGAAEKAAFAHSYTIQWYLVVSGRVGSVVEAASRITATLGHLNPEVIDQEPSGAWSELAAFLEFLVSGEAVDEMPSQSDNLSWTIRGCSLDFDRASGLLRAVFPYPIYTQYIGVRRWPETLNGQMIGDILGIDASIEITQTCLPIGQDTAVGTLRRKKQEHAAPLIGNSILAEEYHSAAEGVSGGMVSLWKTQWAVAVSGPDPEAVREAAEKVRLVLGRYRVNYQTARSDMPMFYFARHPGHDRLARSLTLPDSSLATLWACPWSSVGMTASPYGDKPVRLFRTPSGQGYAFQYHIANRPQSLANYLIIAPSESGKTTLEAHLLGGLAKFPNVRGYIFDSNNGFRFMVEALGGTYQSYEDIALNPLDIGGGGKADRQRVVTVLRAMLGSVSDETGLMDELDHLVRLAFDEAKTQYTLSELYSAALSQHLPVREAMTKWVTHKGKEGMYAHVFNARRDSLSSLLTNAHMVGINMNEALSNEELGPPIVAHISASIKAAAERAALQEGGGFNIFIDEAANLIRNDGFKAVVTEMYREYRKLNGSVGMAFQDPAALERSGIAEAIIENTATFLFFPNSQATPRSLAPFNLNDEQIAFITKGGGGGGQRRVLVVRRHAASGIDESTILDVDLAMLGDAVRFYRSGVSANALMDQLKQEHGDQWVKHL